jgi:hypothetical protein
MISHEEIKQALKSDWVEHVIPTNAKRVIITLPNKLIGKNVKYINWTGKETTDNGFLFFNSTDKRQQFLRADGGILIGYEGECPEGENGEMISRSQAVSNYLKKHPLALSCESNIKKTIEYFKEHIFKHGIDVTKWDKNANPDIWSSDVEWLVVNFDDKDIFDKNMQLKPVISAVKVTSVFDAVYFGPNLIVEGIGTTSTKGSWILSKNKKFNLITDDAFKCAYKKIDKKNKKNIRTR